MTKEMYDGVATENKFDESHMIVEYFAYEVSKLEANGYSVDEILAALLHKGDLSLSAKGLDAEKDYVYLAGAIARTETGLVLVSEVTRGDYITGKAPLSDMTFEVSVENIRKTNAHVKVTPSKLDEKYIWLCSNYTEENKNATPDELMTSYYTGLGPFVGMVQTSGAKDFPDFSVVAGVDYYILAFGFAGGPTTAPVVHNFTTPAGQNPADATIAVEVVNVFSYGAAINFTPSDESVYYAFGMLPAGQVDKEQLIADFEKSIQDNLKMQHSMFPSVTLIDVISLQYFRDELLPYNFPDLEPNTTYDLFTLTISLDGKVAAYVVHPNAVKTPGVSTATTTLDVLGYYDGDQEAGQVFGNAAATAGKPIFVLKYTPSNADVAKIYTAIVKDSPDFDELDPTVISDKDLRNQLRWSSLNVKAPYLFLVAEWDAAQNSFAYTEGVDGAQGAIIRTAMTAAQKANVGTIDELKAHYAAANVEDKAPAKMSMSAAKMVPSVKQIESASLVSKKNGMSVMDSYINSITTEQPQITRAPYRIGSSNSLPIARIAK